MTHIRENDLEEKTKIVFNAFNTEYSAFIDGFLLDDEKYLTATDLYHKSIELVRPELTPGGESARNGNKAIHNHLKHGLSKAKLQYMVEEKNNPLGWRRDFSTIPNHDDIARFLLQQSSIKADMSLFSWLGKNQLDGPYNTIKLLECVVKYHCDTVIHLTKHLDLSTQTVIAKLRKLEKLNLVKLSTFYKDTGKGNIMYRWNKKGRRKIIVNGKLFKYPLLTDKIRSFMKPKANFKKWYSVEDVQRGIKNKYGVDYNSHTVRQALRELDKRSILILDEEWLSGEKLSSVAPTNNAKKFYDNTIHPVVCFLRCGKQGHLKKQINHKDIDDALKEYFNVAMHKRES